jgi:choice-of-anchor A domain-containing protein
VPAAKYDETNYMYNTLISRGAFLSKTVLLAAGALLLGHIQVSASLLDAGVDLGTAGPGPQWGMLLLGNGDGDSEIGGSSLIFGHVGVAGLDGIKIRDYSTLEGDLVLRSKSAFSLSGNAHIIGNVAFDAAAADRLKLAMADAKSASQAAFGLQKTVGFPKTINTNQSLTLTGSGVVVLKLEDFRLAGNAALTLEGDANTTFIINVSDKFSLGGNSRVELSGGVTWENVLFNLRGEGEASLSKNAQVEGIILSKKRTIEMSGNSQVRGEIIAGAIKMSGASVVGQIPVVSP